ncbi:MAG: type II toxin-antitoxin system prevent-host-death family antitoxin [Vicinamibacterales bacterium]
MPSGPRRLSSRVVSATDAVRRFSALIDRVRETRGTYVIESHGEAVAEIVPAARAATVRDLSVFLETGPRALEPALRAIDAASRAARAEHTPPPPRLSGRGGRRGRR